MADVVDEVIQWIIDGAIPGVDGGNPPPQGTGNVFGSERPPKPDNVVVLTLTPGMEPRRELGSGLPSAHQPRMQVIVRHKQDEAALALAWGVWKRLEAVIDQDLSGTHYERIEVLQDPFLLERDEAQRFVYVFNCQIMRRVA